MTNLETTWIEISRSAIAHNVETIRSLIGKGRLFAPCVKGNAYGHGLAGVAKLLAQNGADRLCATSIEEAVTLRKNGIKLPLIIIGFVLQARLPDVIRTRSSISVYESITAKVLSRFAQSAKTSVNVHIKVDTGMGRQGLQPQELNRFIKFIRGLQGLKIEGIATHFATSDQPEHLVHFQTQLKIFLKLRENILASWKERTKPIFHCANSAATLLEPRAHLDMVRPGLAVYGYYPSETVKKICLKRGIQLQPTLTFKTRVAAVKKLPKGACVSYGCTFITKRHTKVAILPVGYYDGIDRGLSNLGSVLIRGHRAPILGRVCMNITVVDVTAIKGVRQEDEVVIIGRQGKEHVTVEEIARHIGTINYEVTTRLPAHIMRYHV